MAAGIGVDVGGTFTKGAVVTGSGECLIRHERPTDKHAGTKGIIAVVEALLEQATAEGIAVNSVGVGAAGFVDAERGAVTFSPNLVYDDPDIAAAVGSRVDLPAFIDNDANAAAWGEFRLGGAKDVEHLVFVTLGTGIGSGFVIGGSLLRGSHGAGAELGHMVIDANGPQCACGLRGCLEQSASGTAIARLARAALDEGRETSITSFVKPGGAPDGEAVARAAREYDEVARGILRSAGSALGLGLANAVNLFDPQVIVLGGSVVRAGEPYLGPARDRLAAMLAAQRRRPVRLDVSTLGADAGILGAALLGIESAT